MIDHLKHRERLLRIHELRQLGVSDRQIGRELGVSNQTIANWMGPRGNHPPPRTSEFIARARAFWDEGLSVREIGRILCVSHNTIVGVAHRNGFTPRPSPLPTPPSTNQGDSHASRR